MKKYFIISVFLIVTFNYKQTGFAQSNNVTLSGQYTCPYNLSFKSLLKSGNYLYVVQTNLFWAGGIGIYDVSDPANIQLINFNPSITVNAFGASEMSVNGDYLYISSCDTTLLIYNISNPLQISAAGYLDSLGVSSMGLQVVGNYLYLCCNNKGLWVIDIQNPVSPVLIESCILSGGFSAHHVSVSGNYAYVTDGTNKLHVIDVSNPVSINEVGSIQMSPAPGGSYLGIGDNIISKGNYAYIANPYYGFQIFDVSNPSAPMPAGTYLSLNEAYDLFLADNYAYIADYGNGLQIIDFYNPLTPFQVGYYYGLNGTQGIFAENNTIYVGASTNLYIFNFTTFGTEDYGNNNINFNIYPNPAKDKITVDISGAVGVASALVYDIQGQLLLQQIIQQAKTDIDLTGLTNGLYIIKFTITGRHSRKEIY